MEFDLTGEHQRYAYKLLAGLVTPRPIAWVTTLDEGGTVNAAPFSFFNVFGTRPPILGFAPGDKEPGIPKDTARNIRRSGEFVVNLVDEASAEAMNQSSRDHDYGISEVDLLQLETSPSTSIAPPRLTAAPVALECREWSTLEIGQNRLVIGLIDRIHTQDGVLDPKTLLVNGDQFSPIGRMEVPSGYCRTQDRFQMKRPD
ncbi:MAG: flavin reductase family protein [Verrucomicrobiales bacterium]|nr:flavin reductase family protein [Verrucomicrobiales bacterium]